jgi:S-formylglutathione hydrolase FrmB
MVHLDPTVPTGHCVFADSANNGPWGTALVKEFSPYIEKTFRGYGKPEGRFVTGHSSGGWSSLWLQVTYPETFGATWSTAPDPVDFRDFQQIDLYQQGVNMFTDSAGKPRPLARRGDEPIIFYKQFSDMERPIRGEQLGSFEAVFSPRDKDGQPRTLWNRITGAVDNDVALAWRKYDIGHILRTQWKELEPKLKGKLHVYMGTQDTFYLEGAVELLQKDMKALGSDAKVELFPGDHSTVMTRSLRTRIDKEMADQWRAKRTAPLP